MQKLQTMIILTLLCTCTRNVLADPIYAINASQLNASQRGQLTGQHLKTDIQTRLIVWNALLQDNLSANGKALLDSLEQQTDWQKAIQIHAPELAEELRAMAQAAEVNYHQLLSYNLAEEIMTIHSDSYQSCTGFAGFLSDTAALAYNLDIPEFLHGEKRPFVLKTWQQRAYLGFPGILATSVITPDFTVTTNSLPDLMSDGKGLPLPFALRLLGEQNSIEDAIELLKNLDLAVAQNFLLVSRDRIINAEKSASGTDVHEVQLEDAPFFHTNFALYNREYSSVRKTAPVCERYQGLSSYTQNLHKLQSTDQLLAGIRSTIDSETFFTLSVAYSCGETQIQLFLPQQPQQNVFPY